MWWRRPATTIRLGHQLADSSPHRWIATPTAHTHVLTGSARDDVLDIVDVVFGDLQRAATYRGRKRRAGELRHYDEAAAAVHTRMRALLDALDDAGVPAAVVERLRAGRGDIEEEMGTVAALMRPPGDRFHERLVACYRQIRRLLPRLLDALELEPSTPRRAGAGRLPLPRRLADQQPRATHPARRRGLLPGRAL